MQRDMLLAGFGAGDAQTASNRPELIPAGPKDDLRENSALGAKRINLSRSMGIELRIELASSLRASL